MDPKLIQSQPDHNHKMSTDEPSPSPAPARLRYCSSWQQMAALATALSIGETLSSRPKKPPPIGLGGAGQVSSWRHRMVRERRHYFLARLISHIHLLLPLDKWHKGFLHLRRRQGPYSACGGGGRVGQRTTSADRLKGGVGTSRHERGQK